MFWTSSQSSSSSQIFLYTNQISSSPTIFVPNPQLQTEENKNSSSLLISHYFKKEIEPQGKKNKIKLAYITVTKKHILP
jgi:hypothetical protein